MSNPGTADQDDAPRVMRAYTSCRLGQLHYRYALPKRASDAPPLVMLHQNPSSSQEYEPLIAEMARDRAVFALDTPGNGMSDAPREPLSMAGYAECFADALHALGVSPEQPVDLFGFHTGTYLAIELALTMPDCVRRLVLSGIPMRSAEECAKALAAAEAIGMPDDDGAEIMEWLRWLWDFTVAQRLPGVPKEIAIRTFADKATAMHRRAWPYIGVWSYPAAERLPQLRQPVLILQPDEPLSNASRAAADIIPDARFVALPDLTRDVLTLGVESFSHHMRSFLS